LLGLLLLPGALLLSAVRPAWAGPVASAFGQHLVRVRSRTAARLPPLAEVRTAVAREWENERRTSSLAANDKALRGRYQVIIDATLSTSDVMR
jgi:parvulin-like peptidyl-prolyl isomerase